MRAYLPPRRLGVDISAWREGGLYILCWAFADALIEIFYNTAAKSNRFGTQDKPNKNVIRTWAT
ncbi:hypothetical protein, partial [uncultured Duncaniella sp.]|uniref:hypothetical protein n=1 Tax=uncultured Duncaniella sp. TaxID=2768039 RepID=UPI0025B643D8